MHTYYYPLELISQPLLLAARENVYDTARIISILHLVLFINSLICIYRFFYPEDRNRTGQQLFNFVFGLSLHAFSIYFLITHKDFYVGFHDLSDAECIRRYFTQTDPVELAKKLVFVAMILNIVYVVRHAKGYYTDM